MLRHIETTTQNFIFPQCPHCEAREPQDLVQGVFHWSSPGSRIVRGYPCHNCGQTVEAIFTVLHQVETASRGGVQRVPFPTKGVRLGDIEVLESHLRALLPDSLRTASILGWVPHRVKRGMDWFVTAQFFLQGENGLEWVAVMEVWWEQSWKTYDRRLSQLTVEVR